MKIEDQRGQSISLDYAIKSEVREMENQLIKRIEDLEANNNDF